jgi:signal transduction histidine kinase
MRLRAAPGDRSARRHPAAEHPRGPGLGVVTGRLGGIGARIALAALAVAAVTTAILGVGVVVIGGQTFAELMQAHGQSVESSRRMFDDAVIRVVVVALVVAVVVAAALAMWLGQRLAAPLRDIDASAQRIAGGHYDGRIPRSGAAEIAGLADSFNQMAAALEEQERMRREFIANAAHELRTPLTNLKGYLEALRDGVIPVDRAAFESLLEETERLVRLAHSLDTLSATDERGAGVAVELDLAGLVRAAVELAQPQMLARHLRLTVELPATLPARGDPDMLAKVVGNLIQNAVRYTPESGSVTITGARRESDLLVSVANSGEPIPAADLPHVFERFFRVERSRDAARGGAGIGLAIVRQIVEASGGTVGVESNARLTRFWFSLPAAGQVAMP